MLSGWGWHVGPGEDHEPDVMVFRRDAPGEDVLREAPLLVVEVVSTGTRQVDYGRKVEAYARGGAGSYWVVDPGAHEVTVLRLDGTVAQEERLGQGRHLLAQPFGVRLDVDRLFA